jgi:hypothetical protein
MYEAKKTKKIHATARKKIKMALINLEVLDILINP